MPINGSVGHGGANHQGDVFFVQLLLSDTRIQRGLGQIAIDGIVGAETTGAISAFQKQSGIIADGRIDPNGPTLRKLEQLHLDGAKTQLLYRNVAGANRLRPRTSEPPSAEVLQKRYLAKLRESLA